MAAAVRKWEIFIDESKNAILLVFREAQFGLTTYKRIGLRRKMFLSPMPRL
jgi:hypothetical protein